MLTKRQPKVLRTFSDKLQEVEHSEIIENIVKTTSTNNDELVKRVTRITEEHLSNLVPVIADLMSFVSNRVKRHALRMRSGASIYFIRIREVEGKEGGMFRSICSTRWTAL